MTRCVLLGASASFTGVITAKRLPSGPEKGDPLAVRRKEWIHGAFRSAQRNGLQLIETPEIQLHAC